MCLELTRSLRAFEQSFNGPLHTAVQGGVSHPCRVEQPMHLNTKTFEGGSGGSNVMSMLIGKPISGSGTRTTVAALSSPEVNCELQRRRMFAIHSRSRSRSSRSTDLRSGNGPKFRG